MAKRRYALALVLVLQAYAASAASPCSFDSAYPEVSGIELVDGAIEVTLGAYFSDAYVERRVYRLAADGDWQPRPDRNIFTDRFVAESCPADMDPPLDENWLRNWTRWTPEDGHFEQSMGACTSDGRALWGGTSFYGGEGYWGVGALVRKDLATGRYRYYHSVYLKRYSINHLAVFGNNLWIGTTHHGECTGPEPGFGVFRFSLRELEYVRAVPDVCGFATRGMLVHDDRLWIATDLGLSIGRIGENGKVVWQNYVPDPDSDEPMRKVECDALYKELLQSERFATDFDFFMGFAFEDFWRRLRELRPAFTATYLRELHGHPAGEQLREFAEPPSGD